MGYLYLSLGSNIEPGVFYLKEAFRCLSSVFKPVKVSSLYETSPMDDLDQSNFINAVCCFEIPSVDPFSIMKTTKEIETKLGRVKDPLRPKGPRVIDIDIILAGDVVIDTPELTIPHKSMLERNFVLVPLTEIMDENEHDFVRYVECIKKNRDQIVNKVGVFEV